MSMTHLVPLDIRRILIIRPNHRLGNNALMTPLMSETERLFPQARFDVLTGGGASKDLYAGFPNLGTVHAFPAWSYIRPHKVFGLIRRVCREPYDLAIDPMPRSRSARFLIGLANARCKLGYRWDDPRPDARLTHSIDAHDAPPHLAQAPVHLLRTAVDDADSPMPTLDLRLSTEERSSGHRLLEQVLGDATGAPRSGARVLRIGLYGVATGAKQYSPRWWMAFLDGLQKELATMPHEMIEILPHDGRSTLAGRMPGLLSVRLRELGAALGALDAFITADCGVMHLASAAGTRTIGLFKVTDPVRYGPYGHGSASIAAEDAAPEAAARAAVALLRQPRVEASATLLSARNPPSI